MLGVAIKTRSPARLIGTALLLQLAVLRIIASGNSDHAWLLGRELYWGCWFKQQFGIPCPTCGMTRSVILTVHGHIGEAFTLNVGGPFLVAGLFVLALILFYREGSLQDQRSTRRLALGMIAYGWVFAVVLIGQWTLRLAG